MTKSNSTEVIDNSMSERRLQVAWIAVQDAERAEATAREEADRRRAALAKLLVEERKQFPERGPAAAGWGALLARVGISQQRAWELMKLAKIAPPGGDTLPSLRGAGIKPRERDAGERPRARHEQQDSAEAEKHEPDEDGDTSEPRAESPTRVAAKKRDKQEAPDERDRDDARRAEPRGGADESQLAASLIREINRAIAGIDNLSDLARALRGFIDQIDSMADCSDREN